MQYLIGKVRAALEANRQKFFPPPSETFDLEQFKTFSQTEFSGEEHRKTLEKLLADDEKFRKELEAMMQGLKGLPFKGKPEIIGGAIDGILAEFKYIVDGIGTSGITPPAQPDAQPGAPPLEPQKSSSLDSLSSFGSSSNVGSLGEPSQTSDFEEQYLRGKLGLLTREKIRAVYEKLKEILKKIFAFADAKKYNPENLEEFNNEFKKLLETYIFLFSNSSDPIPPKTIVKVLDDFLESNEGLKSLNERFETDTDTEAKINSLQIIKSNLISLLQTILETQNLLSDVDASVSVGKPGAKPSGKPASAAVPGEAALEGAPAAEAPAPAAETPPPAPAAEAAAPGKLGKESKLEPGAKPGAKPPAEASVGTSASGSSDQVQQTLPEDKVVELEREAIDAVDKLTSSRASGSSDEELRAIAERATLLKSQAAAARATRNLADAANMSEKERDAALDAERKRLEDIIREAELAIKKPEDKYTVEVKTGELATARDRLNKLNTPKEVKLSVEIEGVGSASEEEKKELESLVGKGDSMEVFLKIEEKSIFEETEVLKVEEEKLARLKEQQGQNNPMLAAQIVTQQEKIHVLRERLQESKEKFAVEKERFAILGEEEKRENLRRLIREAGKIFTQSEEEMQAANKELTDKAELLKREGEERAAAVTASRQQAAKEAAEEVAQSKKQAEFVASEVFYKKFNTRYFDGTDFTTELSNIETGNDSVKTALQYDKLGKIGKIDIQLFNPLAKEELSEQISEGSESEPEIQADYEVGVEPLKKGGALKSTSEEVEQQPGILNEINIIFKSKERAAKAIKDKYEGEDGFIKQLETINAQHKPEPGEGITASFISQEEGRRGDSLMKDYLAASKKYLIEYSLPYTYKKLINLFIYYITYYNKFQNSFLIKKLENLRNSSKYKTLDGQNKIDKAFESLAGGKIAGSNISIDAFFKYHFHLNGRNFMYILPLVEMLKADALDEYKKSGLDDLFITNYKEIVTDLKNLFQGEGEEQTKEAVANVKISDLNKIIFKYISIRFPIIRRIAELKDLNLLFFEHDIALLGFMYFIILKLAENFKDEYNKLIAEIFNDQVLYSLVSKFFNEHSDSSVISYVKIRDGANEKEEKNQLSNPRYIYYSDIDFEANLGPDGLSLGLEKESPSATLSLFYCNNPTQELKIPEQSQHWLEKKKKDPRLITGDDLVLEALDYDKLDDEKSNIFPKYDHLFHFGHFNKILHNDNNEKFGSKMTEVITKLTTDPLSDVFIIGYGASGAGKTTTLIYDKNQPEGKRDGAVVYMLNKLAQDPQKGANYQEITLTITELFMAEPDITTKANEIFPTLLNKITNEKFTYGADGIFRGTINYEKYKKANDDANTGLPDAMGSPKYKGLFLQKGEGLDFQEDSKDFTLSEILQLLIDKKRKVSGTTNNPQSSRSHVLSSISFTNVTKGDTKETLKLYIGDFAGVENKFDYSSFTYGNDLNKFPAMVLEEIYKLASMIDQQFPTNEDGIYLRDYQNKVKDLLQIEQAEQLAPKLEELENINILVHTICLLNPDLLGKTIKDYAFLKHPQEKYQEVYDKIHGKNAWKEEIAGRTAEEVKFDKESPLVYFYELLKGPENQDSQLMKKVGEMIPMIGFLTDSKTGYGDSYDKLRDIERIIKKEQETKVNVGQEYTLTKDFTITTTLYYYIDAPHEHLEGDKKGDPYEDGDIFYVENIAEAPGRVFEFVYKDSLVEEIANVQTPKIKISISGLPATILKKGRTVKVIEPISGTSEYQVRVNEPTPEELKYGIYELQNDGDGNYILIDNVKKQHLLDMGVSIFKPQNTGSKSVQQVRFEGEKEVEIQKMDSNELEKAGVEEKYGLLNPYETRPGVPIKYSISNIKKFEIKHPGINLKSKSPFLKTLPGVNLMTLLAQQGLESGGNLQVIDDKQRINPSDLRDEDKRKGVSVVVTRQSDNVGGGMVKACPTVSHNRILAAICSRTLKQWLIERGVKATFSKGGNAWGNFIKNVELKIDNQFNFTISKLELADFNEMKTNLGLISHVYKLQDTYDKNRHYRLSIAPNVPFERSDLLGTQVGAALGTLQNATARESLKQKIIANFNDIENAEERNDPFGSLSYGGGIVKGNMTFNELSRLLREMEGGEVKKVKDKIREKSSKDTEKIDQKIQINRAEISKFDKLIDKEKADQEKYLMLAEAAVKRIYHIHYEVIKRTYEGLFINKSLEQMRFTMTDVLQATNKANGQSTSLVPNFNSKCTNYYSNVLLEDLFQENTGFNFSGSGATDEDEDPDKVDNRNRFNVIHQIIAKNKIIGSKSPGESPKPDEVTLVEPFGDNDFEKDSELPTSRPPLQPRATDLGIDVLPLLSEQQVPTEQPVPLKAGGSVRQVGGKEIQETITNKTKTHKIIQETITDKLKGGITYCVCLLLNNSYIETQNKKLVNNPPKIPYIDLTEAYTELNRFYRRNKYIQEQIPKPSNLVFVKYYNDKDKRGGPANYLLTKSVRKSITEMTGFSYEEFTSKNFHIHIFENINTYMLYCYSAAIKNFTIPPGKIIEINKEFQDLKDLAEALRYNTKLAGVRQIQEIINQAKKYLFLIEVMNGTSVIGTIDFADEISKYNLKYNKSSVSQFNILHKSRSELYASDYDYLRRFRYFLGGVGPSIQDQSLGVHAFIPITPSVLNLVWRCFILPALLKLGEGHSIYHSLIKNKMKICLEHSENAVIKEILKPFRDETKDLMKFTILEIDDSGDNDDHLKQVNVSKQSFDIIKVSKANKGGQPTGNPVLKFEVPILRAPAAPPGLSVELDYPQDYNEDDDLSEQDKALVTKLELLPEEFKMDKIIEKIKNIKNQRVYLQELINEQNKQRYKDIKAELEALKVQERENREQRVEQKARDSRFKLYNDRNDTQIKEGEKIILLGRGGSKSKPDGRTLDPDNTPIKGIKTNDDESKEEVNILIPPKIQGIVVDVETEPNLLIIKFTDFDFKSEYPEGNINPEYEYTSLGLVKIINTGEQDETKSIGSEFGVITEVDLPKYESILQREKELAASRAEDELNAQRIANIQQAPPPQQRRAPQQQVDILGQDINQNPFVMGDPRASRQATQRQLPPGGRQPLPPRGRQPLPGGRTQQINREKFQNMTRLGGPLGRGGSKTRKYSKFKLKQPKKIERKYKQSLKNKVKVNHSQVNRENLLNEYLNNKTKRHLRLKLKEKKKPVKKYKKSFKK